VKIAVPKPATTTPTKNAVVITYSMRAPTRDRSPQFEPVDGLGLFCGVERVIPPSGTPGVEPGVVPKWTSAVGRDAFAERAQYGHHLGTGPARTSAAPPAKGRAPVVAGRNKDSCLADETTAQPADRVPVRTSLCGNATRLWAVPDPNFGYWKIIEQRLAARFAAFGAIPPKFLARDPVLAL
jgi:hypothetical protein